MATTEPSPLPQPTPEELAAQREAERQQRNFIITVSAIVLLILIALGFGIWFMLRPETSGELVGKIRDVFIIVLALVSLLIGFALVILMIQVASLVNLLQNEIRPIIKATNETVNTLRGTAEFLGENVVEPVIKLNSYMAGLQRVLELMGLKRK